MRISREMRLQGAVLLSILFLQGMVAPVGACQMTHESEGPDHSMMSEGHHGEKAQDGGEQHDPGPADCFAISGCGAPAISAERTAEPSEAEMRLNRSTEPVVQGPAMVDLGISTPPPKIQG
jgi:hypothetical protein